MQLFDGKAKELGDIVTTITDATSFVLGLVGALAVIFIIIGGIQLSISAGNPQGQEKAKKTITNAIGGLVLAICAATIGNFVIGIFK